MNFTFLRILKVTGTALGSSSSLTWLGWLNLLILEVRSEVLSPNYLWSATLLKLWLWHSCFPVNFAKFLRTPFLTEHFRWLLLILRPIYPEGLFYFCIYQIKANFMVKNVYHPFIVQTTQYSFIFCQMFLLSFSESVIIIFSILSILREI